MTATAGERFCLRPDIDPYRVFREWELPDGNPMPRVVISQCVARAHAALREARWRVGRAWSVLRTGDL